MNIWDALAIYNAIKNLGPDVATLKPNETGTFNLPPIAVSYKVNGVNVRAEVNGVNVRRKV